MSYQPAKNGITIIEVLTAMVVALIGVFGVMVLIPFAVKQAETGLDLDDAFRLARNANAQMQMTGQFRLYPDPVDGIPKPSWYAGFDDDNNVNTPKIPVRVSAPNVYSLDPLSVVARGEFDQFPPAESIARSGFNVGFDAANRPHNFFPYIEELSVGVYNGATQAVANLGPIAAREMFISKDDLVFQDPGADLAAPLPVYDQYFNPNLPGPVANQIVNAGRQSVGELSWSALLVPMKDDQITHWNEAPAIGTGGWKFRMHTMVYKNRVPNPATMRMPVAAVIGPAFTGTQTSVDWVDPSSGNPPNNEIIIGTGSTITLNRAFAVANAPVDPTLQWPSDVQKNDWIMLVNEDPDLEPGFQKQVAFYRITSVGVVSPTDATVTLTLDGPDFSFRTQAETEDINNSGSTPMEQILTYAVLLVNFDTTYQQRLGRVVNVYERTFQLEQDSDWAK